MEKTLAIDDSKTLRSFPFNELTLPADETVILTCFNPTFRRPDLKAALISNKALYLGDRWQKLDLEEEWQERPLQWRRFPLTEIEYATLASGEFSVAYKETILLIGLLAAEFLVFAFAKWGITALGGYLLFYGVPTLALIALGVWEGIRSQQATCALLIEMDAGTYTWRMPRDDYADEKEYDCRMVRSTWDKLAELGVRTTTYQSA